MDVYIFNKCDVNYLNYTFLFSDMF